MATTALQQSTPPKAAPKGGAAKGGTSQRKEEERALAIHTGQMIRLRRRQLGLSQEKLGDALGITFQQVQKYEKGSNRTSGPTLAKMARALEVPITYFFPSDDWPVFADPGLPPTLLARIDKLAGQVETLASSLREVVAALKA